MKRNLSIILVLMVLSVLLIVSGCKKDDENDNGGSSASGSFAENGSTYSTPKGYIVGPLNSGGGCTGFYIAMVSNSINCSWSEEYDDVRALGTGNGVTFTLWSVSSDKPATGDYTWHVPTGYPAPYEYDGWSIGINFNYTSEEGTIYQITGGTIKVNESGSHYDVTYTFTCEGNHNFTGNYKGNLQAIVPPQF